MNNNFQKLTAPFFSGAKAEEDATGIDLMALVATLWRGRPILLAAMVCTTLIGGFYAYRIATPVYTASATVMMDTRQKSVVDLPSVLGDVSGSVSEVNSEVQVLQSRYLLGAVVDALNLVDDPEFNGSLNQPSATAILKTRVKGLLGLNPPPSAALSEEERARRTRDSVVSALRGSINVRAIPQSLVFDLSVVTESAAKSARIADRWAELYLSTQVDTKLAATDQASTWLEGRVSELQAKLEDAEQKAKDFSLSTSLVSPENLALLERQLKDTRDRISSLKMTLQETQAKIALMEAATTPAARTEAAADPQLSGLLGRVGDPAIAQAFDARFTTLLAGLKVNATQTLSQLRTLQAAETNQQNQIEAQSADLINLQQLQREADANRMLYQHFLTSLNETAAQEGLQQADSRILSSAVVPSGPSAPRNSLILAMSMMLGFVIGAAIVILREMRADTFRTSRELETITGQTVLGQIPMLPSRGRKNAIAYLKDRPTSAAAEAIRNLRTSVLLSNLDTPPQVIMMTSSLPGEGKTTMSLALAQNFVGLGKKVLVIEGDIRRRVFNQYMTTENRPGLLALLSGQAGMSDVIIHDETIGADVLIGDKGEANAADVFSSDSFASLIGELRRSYDIIVIDTPPALLVPDARIIATHCDVLLFTVAWDKTARPQLTEALRMFETAGLRINGLVLNQISEQGMKSYGYSGSYGAYASYGRKYYHN